MIGRNRSNAQPPVAKIYDFKKFLYQESKKNRRQAEVKVLKQKSTAWSAYEWYDYRSWSAARGFLEGGDKTFGLKLREDKLPSRIWNMNNEKITDALHGLCKDW